MRIGIPFKRYGNLLATYLKPQWNKILCMFVVLLLSIGLQLLNPQILKTFIDAVTLKGVSTSLLILALLFIGVALINQVAAVATSYLSTDVAWMATNRLRRDLLAYCLALDLGYHKTRTPGEMIERIDGDVDRLSNFFSQFVVNVLGHALLLLGILVLFFTVAWFVGVAMLTFVVVALLAMNYLRRRAVPFWEKMREKSALFFGFLGERLAATEDIRASGATAYTMRRFLLLLRQWFPVFQRALRATILMYSLLSFLFGGASVLSLALGAYLWSIQAISPGTVFLLFSYTTMLNYPLQELQTQLQDLQQAEACIRRVEELLHTRSALRDGPGHAIPSGALSVDFQRVTFGYVPDEPVIHDLSFHVQPGKVLGMLGRTGSGKTTIARLLFRLYDPQQGEIRLGNVPLHLATLRDLRRHIGMVTQDVQLFHGSVRDNLTFFDRTIPDERILAVLQNIGLSEWYHSLPDGLESELGKEGEGLSAGEAQLLAFARVFLSDPGLVIFDEASSRLDSATERQIEQAIDKLLVNRTAIIIAHRLATIQRADDILIIEHGRILEYGSRQTLIDDPASRLSHLLRTSQEGRTV